MRELQGVLDVMRHKVRIYEEHVARGEADRLWNPSHPERGQDSELPGSADQEST
ncbi:hypothetical protein ACWGB8_11280 [Kitasatospora sp. NPDC054939]